MDGSMEREYLDSVEGRANTDQETKKVHPVRHSLSSSSFSVSSVSSGSFGERRLSLVQGPVLVSWPLCVCVLSFESVGGCKFRRLLCSLFGYRLCCVCVSIPCRGGDGGGA